VGRSLIAWSEPDGVRVARRPAGGNFAAPQTLITDESELKGEVDLDLDADGRAVLAFSEGPRDNRITSAHVAVALGSAQNGFGAPAIVSGPFARDVVADVTGGVGAVTWRAASGRNSRVQAVTSAGDALGRTQTLSGRNARRPDVVAAPNGRITVVWERLTDRGRNIEASSRADTQERFPDFERVSKYGDVIAPDVEANARGEQFVAWTRQGRGLSRAESAKASSLTGRFTRVLTIFDGRTSVGETVESPRLEPAGNVMQAVYLRRITQSQRLFWDLSTYAEPR
jgi:hypothetical protein